MRKINLILCLFIFVSSFGTIKANDTVMVDINLDVMHSVDTITTFDRKKFITIHASPTEHDWKQTGMSTDDMDYLFNDLDVYFGRDNGQLGWQSKNVQQDPSRLGYALPSSILSRGTGFKNDYKNTSLWNRYDGKTDVMMGGQPSSMWAADGIPQASWSWAGADAAGEFLGLWCNSGYRAIGDGDKNNGMPMNRFVELMNEPLYHFVDDVNVLEEDKATPLEVFTYHRDAAIGFKRVNTSGSLFGGFTVAFPFFDEDNFNRWDKRMKLFMDTAGRYMDFYSIHIYDFNKHQNGTRMHFKGSRVEATMDMMENYSIILENEVKPFIVSEYGGRDLQEEYKTWSADRDWKFMKAYTPLMMTFMDKPDRILKTIPFIAANYYWSMDYGASAPYPWRLFRKENEPAENTGDYVFTEFIKFYELWSDVNGIRIDSWTTCPDVKADAYVEGNKAYVIVSNLALESQNIKFNILGDNGNAVQQIKVKHLHAVNELPVLDVNIYTNLDDFTLDSEASAIIEYTFASNVTINQKSEEVKYYSDTIKQEIAATTPLIFNINNITTFATGEGILRVSFGRDHDLSKAPVVKINGVELILPAFGGDTIQPSRDAFYGMLEIPVKADEILINNIVSVEFPDAGGFVSSVTLQTFKFSREITRSNAVTGVALYPSSIEMGDTQERQLTANVFPVYAHDIRIQWESDNDGIVEVDANGKLMGKSVGDAIITATTVDGGYKATCSVKVVANNVPVLVDTIIITPNSADLIETKMLQLNYHILPIDADDKSVTWGSSNASASVSQTGLVTAISKGAADITILSSNGKTYVCPVNVIERVEGTLTFDDKDKYLTTDFEVGKSLPVSCNYVTSTGETVKQGIEYKLVVTDNNENIYKGYTSYDNDLKGNVSGSSAVTVSTLRATPSNELPSGQFYKIILTLEESDGNKLIAEVSPINIVDPVGIDDNILEAGIYPNPANSIITIESEEDIEAINIFNTVGSLVLSAELIDNTVDISSLPEGVYILEISNNNKRKITKLVIQR